MNELGILDKEERLELENNINAIYDTILDSKTKVEESLLKVLSKLGILYIEKTCSKCGKKYIPLLGRYTTWEYEGNYTTDTLSKKCFACVDSKVMKYAIRQQKELDDYNYADFKKYGYNYIGEYPILKIELGE